MELQLQSETQGGARPGAVPFLPQPSSNRILSLDVLRGLALLGVVLVNYASPSLGGPRPLNSFDAAVAGFLELFVHHKAYPILSLLFGAGMAIQMRNAGQRNSPFVLPYMRRAVLLFGIGVFHAVFIWNGDILHVYAMFAVVLLLFRKASDVVLTTIAISSVVLSRYAPEITSYLNAVSPNHSQLYGAEATHLFTHEPYLTLVGVRATNLLEGMTHLRGYIATLDIFGMFLIGFALGRARLLEKISEHRRAIQVTAVICTSVAVFGLGYNILMRFVEFEPLKLAAVKQFTSISKHHALALAYAAIALLLLEYKRFAAAASHLAMVGRVSLSCYLLQSIIAVLIFYRPGLGLHRALGTTAVFLLALLVYTIQIPIAHWYMQRFEMGPAEWMWRCAASGVFRSPKKSPKSQVECHANPDQPRHIRLPQRG